MNNETFERLVREIRAASIETLMAKNSKYAPTDDRLHNFREGGKVMGGTPAQACWGYLTKHLVALRDMVSSNDFSDLNDLKEKCQDAINYIVFLWCIGYEEGENQFEEHYAGLGLSPEERAPYAAHR